MLTNAHPYIYQPNTTVVDGTGLQEIEDEDVAKKILEKVNKMNSSTGGQSAIIALIYAALAVPGRNTL